MCITKIEILDLSLPCHHCEQITTAQTRFFDASQDLVLCSDCAEKLCQPTVAAPILPAVANPLSHPTPQSADACA
ncbi:MAG TPA: hypothetical protein DCM08_09050 [Microscillaceae bacterium]|nr:hypothetical protein [Microscillaceae bacterium]